VTDPTVVLWDIDGTLLRAGDPDHIGGLATALTEHAGRTVVLDGIALGGNIERRICRMALTSSGVLEPHEDIIDAAIASLGRRYVSQVIDRSDRILPGVTDALEACAAAGMIQGVLTGGARSIARHKLLVSGLEQRLRFGAYGDEAEERHELVDHAMAEATIVIGAPVQRSSVIVVGDTPADIEAARVAGVAVVAVATGRWTVADLAAHDPDVTLPDLADTASVVRAIAGAVGS
jgi:phosphoglycolate phosphatase